MPADAQIRRLTLDRREFTTYRAACPNCAGSIGPRYVLREFLDVPPDPPYAALVRCPVCGETMYVEFTPSA